ncbi:hypothetical protein LINPERHAP1_LOCUS26780 [Linum perenne]
MREGDSAGLDAGEEVVGGRMRGRGAEEERIDGALVADIKEREKEEAPLRQAIRVR